MLRAILLSGVIAALSADAVADDQVWRAVTRYADCNVDAALRLAGLKSRHATEALRSHLASEALALCRAEENALAMLLQGITPEELRSWMQRINEKTVEEHSPLMCAGAEWRGCSMKPIPEWKGVRR